LAKKEQEERGMVRSFGPYSSRKGKKRGLQEDKQDIREKRKKKSKRKRKSRMPGGQREVNVRLSAKGVLRY